MTVAWQADSTWTSPNVIQELSNSFQGGNGPLVVRQLKFTMLLIGHRDRQDSGTDGVTHCTLGWGEKNELVKVSYPQTDH